MTETKCPKELTLKEKFEKFCKEYNLDYDFGKIGRDVYGSQETSRAFIVYKYSDYRNYV